jgi:malate dehydrogenase (quinone)
VLEKYFSGELTASAWLPKLRAIIPSYGVSLIEDTDLLRSVRAETAQVLKVENIAFPAVAAQRRA